VPAGIADARRLGGRSDNPRVATLIGLEPTAFRDARRGVEWILRSEYRRKACRAVEGALPARLGGRAGGRSGFKPRG
jgi:hypothetical protein